MKKMITMLVVVLMFASLATACTGKPVQEAYEPAEIRIGGLRGPTSMGMVQLMELAEKGEAANNYSFQIAGSADELTPKLLKGELDIAALPANLASVMYNNTEKEIRLLAINTLGVIYIVETGDEIHSMKDLEGKTLYATGKGSTPEYALRYLLEENGVNPDADVRIEWKSEPTESVAILQESGGIAMMPQPYVTVAQMQLGDLRVAVDFTREWDALDNGSTLITGVLVVRKAFAEQYPDQIAAFLNEYRASTEYVNANIKEAAQLIEKFDIVKASVAERAIPYCYITCVTGEDMVEPMGGYLGVLYQQNPKAIGGSIPAEDFYYAP